MKSYDYLGIFLFQHDDPNDEECSPGSRSRISPDGNFIMYASATGGEKDNNFLFSPCSTRSIAKVSSRLCGYMQFSRQCMYC